MTESLRTPSTSIDVAEWLSTLSASDVAFVQGCAFGWLARHAGMSEADLYAEWAERAASDPDCHLVIPLSRVVVEGE